MSISGSGEPEECNNSDSSDEEKKRLSPKGKRSRVNSMKCDKIREKYQNSNS